MNADERRLEKNLRREQNRSRRGPCFRPLPERAAAWCGVGWIELRVVQSVDPFEAQLELHPFPDPRVLDDRKIQVVGSIPTDSGEAGTQCPQVLAELQPGVPLKSRIHVEPAVHRARAVRKRNVLQISNEDGVPKA